MFLFFFSEQLANSLRLPQVVPSVQAAVFLCFRVLLLRMSQDNVTSLWPIIISEMVQVFLAIEQELMTDTEEYKFVVFFLLLFLNALSLISVFNKKGYEFWLFFYNNMPFSCYGPKNNLIG